MVVNGKGSYISHRRGGQHHALCDCDDVFFPHAIDLCTHGLWTLSFAIRGKLHGTCEGWCEMGCEYINVCLGCVRRYVRGYGIHERICERGCRESGLER